MSKKHLIDYSSIVDLPQKSPREDELLNEIEKLKSDKDRLLSEYKALHRSHTVLKCVVLTVICAAFAFLFAFVIFRTRQSGVIKLFECFGICVVLCPCGTTLWIALSDLMTDAEARRDSKIIAKQRLKNVIAILLVIGSFIVGAVSFNKSKSTALKKKEVLDSISSTVDSTKSVSPAPQSTQEKAKQYIVNTKTHKFHIPGRSCNPTVNGKSITATRSEMIAKGYSPCQRCCP
ncbi:MAG: hypothetical protein IJM71_05205 [Clostridia bacterium]|nr:hypothetical protein [Clostridia bacterium]